MKTWLICNLSTGEKKRVVGLSRWCRANGADYTTLLRTKNVDGRKKKLRNDSKNNRWVVLECLDKLK